MLRGSESLREEQGIEQDWAEWTVAFVLTLSEDLWHHQLLNYGWKWTWWQNANTSHAQLFLCGSTLGHWFSAMAKRPSSFKTSCWCHKKSRQHFFYSYWRKCSKRKKWWKVGLICNFNVILSRFTLCTKENVTRVTANDYFLLQYYHFPEPKLLSSKFVVFDQQSKIPRHKTERNWKSSKWRSCKKLIILIWGKKERDFNNESIIKIVLKTNKWLQLQRTL